MLPTKLSKEQTTDLDQWLRSLGRVRYGTSFIDGAERWTLWIDDYGRVGIETAGKPVAQEVWITSRPESDDDEEYPQDNPFPQWAEEEERRELQQALGYAPCYWIDISGAYRGSHVRQVIFRLAIWVARRFDCMIVMEDEVSPAELWPRTLGWSAGTTLPEAERREALQAYLRQFPGRALAMHNWIRPGYNTIWHLVDATFLEAWLQHIERSTQFGF